MRPTLIRGKAHAIKEDINVNTNTEANSIKMTDEDGVVTVSSSVAVTMLNSTPQDTAVLTPKVRITKRIRGFFARQIMARDRAKVNAAIPAKGPMDMTVLHAKARSVPQTIAAA